MDDAPLIVSLGLEAEGQARLDALRGRYFPAERNFLSAHVTLFHALPGAEVEAVTAGLREAAGVPAFEVRVAGVRSLGRGVALTVESPALMRVRAGLAARWAPWLGVQDRQGWRPHVTIQNKVSPEEAKRTFVSVSAGFVAWEVGAVGLSLWRYRGGPWEGAGSFQFAVVSSQ